MTLRLHKTHLKESILISKSNLNQSKKNIMTLRLITLNYMPNVLLR